MGQRTILENGGAVLGGPSVLIEKGTVIDGTGAAPFAASVLVENGLITALGADADARAATNPGLRRIDATGLTVMPGLIDAHCHITFDEVSTNDELFFHRRPALAAIAAAHNVNKVLRAGVTGMFDADGIFDIGVDLREAIETGLVEGPRMATGAYALVTSVGGTAGRLFPETGTIGYARILPTRDEIVAEVRRQCKIGVDWIKVHVTGLIPRQRVRGEIMAWTLDELKAVAETAHDLGVPVVGHCRSAESTTKCIQAGFDMLLHATFMDEPTFELIAQTKTPIAPTFTFQANLMDYGAKVNCDPVLQAIFRREIEESADMLRRCYDAGVPLLCGTESGFSVTPYGEWHYRELEVFVRDIGLTPLQAIQCATQAGARCLRLDGKVGVVAPGMMADLIGVAGDPSKDVTVLGDKERMKFVMVGGKEADLATPVRERRPISGWRVNSYGAIMTQEFCRT